MKKTNITLSIALAAVFSSSVAFAEAEVTGKIVHESGKFTNAGIGIGGATTWNQTANSHGKDLMKSETSARIYIDGDADQLQEGATYHVELNLMKDSKGVGDYDSNESYTQRDALREAYIDAETNGYSIRAGKQQVVWGTADGMKLLDAINPTDYSEMAQNQMEDSRMPVFMLNTETEAADGSTSQFIISESKSSKFAGLGNVSGKSTTHTNGDSGHAFIMKGVDMITGQSNGMMNIAPALGAAAKVFDRVAIGFGYTSLSGQTGTRVKDFVDGSANTGFEAVCTDGVNHAGGDASCLAAVAHNDLLDNSATWGAGAGNNNKQNLIDAYGDETKWDIDNPNSAFEYLYETTFATFDTFVEMTSEYRVDHDSSPVFAYKYKNSTPTGMNYSLNFMHGNDTNPYVDVSWEKQDGTKLIETRSANAGNFSGGTDVTLLLVDTVGDTASDVGAQLTPSTNGAAAADRANLVLTERTDKITQIGGSFDTAIETAEFGAVVIRGEALYQKDVRSPVITRKAANGVDLNHGFMASSMQMLQGDRLKFVLGADITVLTNMMVSAQIIQDRNLDYYNTGNKDATDWKYTADMATMSLSNNMNKAEENKEFYSLFLSKPFGASGEHRWNNIFMFEENGGKWNRLDAEFSIDDDTQATVEWNKYFGDENTQFGQLAKSSNIQVGVKYSF